MTSVACVCVVRLGCESEAYISIGVGKARLLVVLIPKELTHAVVLPLMRNLQGSRTEKAIAYLAVTQALSLAL